MGILTIEIMIYIIKIRIIMSERSPKKQKDKIYKKL